MLKKISLVLLSFIIVVIPLAVYAASGDDFKLCVEYEYDENIIVTASIRDIKCSTGISSFEYYIHYDSAALQLVSAVPNIPEEWNDLFASGAVEDISHQDLENSNLYKWALVCIEPEHGIITDNQIFITLEFKPLKDSETKIRIEYDNVATDYVTDTYVIEALKGNSAELTIDLKSPENPNVNTEHDVSTSFSIPGTDDSSTEPDSSSNESASNGGFISLPSRAPVSEDSDNNINSDISDSLASVSETEDDNTLLVISISVGVLLLVVIAIIVFVFVRKSSKGKENV